jgi:hypothetical protein
MEPARTVRVDPAEDKVPAVRIANRRFPKAEEKVAAGEEPARARAAEAIKVRDSVAVRAAVAVKIAE